MTEFHPKDEPEDDSTTSQQFSDLSRVTVPDGLDKEQQPQAELQMESHDQSCDLVSEEKKQKASDDLSDGEGEDDLNDLNASDKEEEEEEGISTKEAQKSMNNIFQILQVDNPHSATDVSSSSLGFDEFTKMLNEPTLAQQREGGGALTSTEKSVTLGAEGPESNEFVSTARAPSSSGAPEDKSEIVNATGAPTPAEHLKLLKEKIPPVESDKVPLLSDLGVTDESIAESLVEQQKQVEAEETPWPDIGQPEMKVKGEKEGEEDKKDGEGEKKDEAGISEPTGWVASGEGGAPVVSGLVMPSADVAIDMTMKSGDETHDVPEQSHDLPEDSQGLSEKDVSPGPPEQGEVGLGQEVGGETLTTELVSKTRKKTRRGTRGKAKKTSTDAAGGAAALVEAGRQVYVCVFGGGGGGGERRGGEESVCEKEYKVEKEGKCMYACLRGGGGVERERGREEKRVCVKTSIK